MSDKASDVAKRVADELASCDVKLVASLPALEKQLDELEKKWPRPAMTRRGSPVPPPSCRAIPTG